jgi:tetratricopeptide (TPR) repeat protein
MAARQRDLQDAYYRVNRALAYDETFRPALAMIVQLEMEAGAAAHQRVHLRVLAWRQLAARVDDRVGASAAERGLGAIQQVTGAGHAAYRHFETALALAYAAGDPYEQMAALDALANLFATWPPPNEASEAAATAARRKRLDWARDWQALSLKLAQAVEDDFAILAAADQLARLAEQRGDVAGLLANRLAALEASQRLAVPGLEATAWLRLSQAYASDQQWDNAVTTAEQCIALGVSPMRSAGHILLAEIFLETDQAETALTELEAAWSLLQDQDNAAAQIACLIRLGEVNRALGRQKAAVAKLEEAIRRAEKLGLPQAEGLRRQLAEWRQSAE